MAVSMLVMYIVVALPASLYSGAVTLRVMFDLNLTHAVWLIGFTAGAYTIYGGLKAVVWSDRTSSPVQNRRMRVCICVPQARRRSPSKRSRPRS